MLRLSLTCAVGLVGAGLMLTGCSNDAAHEPSSETDVGSEPNPAIVSNVSIDDLPILAWEEIEDLPKPIAVFDQVFWEPDDTTSLRKLIRESDLVDQKTVLEIGTGSGLISLCCLQADASRVVATDINPHAVHNASFNSKELGFADRLDVRLVPRRAPGAWTVVKPDERFDIIISNPPWEDGKPTRLAEFALYDPDFELMKSLLDGIDRHLNPDGRVLLAYGCVTAIKLIHKEAADRNLNVKVLDDRNLDDLDELFLPGMLLEITIRQPTEANQD